MTTQQLALLRAPGCWASLRRAALAPVVYYASGANHQGEILGFAKGGVDIGVSAPKLEKDAEHALVHAAQRYGTRCLFDSGAFSEVEMTPAGPRAVAEISDRAWRERLAAALRAAGPHLAVVAPDRVGDQAVTLARMKRYASQVRQLAAAGAQVVVPVQRGPLPRAQFFAAALDALGQEGIPALPMNKDATPTRDLLAFLEEARPQALHLLGIGPRAARFPSLRALLLHQHPALQISCDSVALTAAIGRGAGPGQERPLTRALDELGAALRDRWYSGAAPEFDYTDHIAEPSGWMSPAELRAFAAQVGAPLMADIDGWLQAPAESGEPRLADPRVELALDAAWRRYVAGYGSEAYRKREAILRLIRGEHHEGLRSAGAL